MNFLAHLVLAPTTPMGRVGSIAPDMIRGPLPRTLHPDIAAAAAEHQRIDRFTDSHPLFHRTRQRLVGFTDARLTGVLADVLYDHVLARDWCRHRPDPIARFIAAAQRDLLDHLDHMPADMRWSVELMAEQQWLASYASVAGIRARLDQMSARISRRLGKTIRLTPTARQIELVYPGLAEDFDRFWADLQAFVTEHRRRAPDTRLAS